MTENILDTINTITNRAAFVCVSSFSFFSLIPRELLDNTHIRFTFMLVVSFCFMISLCSCTTYYSPTLFVSILLYASIIKHLYPLIIPGITLQHLLEDSLEFLLGTYISIYVYPPIYIYKLFFFIYI